MFVQGALYREEEAQLRGLVPEPTKHSFHAVWNSADLRRNPEILHNYANGPDGSMMSGFLFDIFTPHSACCEDPHATRRTLKVDVGGGALDPV